MNTVIATIALFSSMTGYEGTPINRQDINCMARAVYHEARGESLVGQTAVAWVVKNRVGHEWYKDSVCGVVYQSKQFTDLYRSTKMHDEDKFILAIEVALLVQTGYLKDPTKSSVMYFNPQLVPNPRWNFDKISYALDIENHRFYKENE